MLQRSTRSSAGGIPYEYLILAFCPSGRFTFPDTAPPNTAAPIPNLFIIGQPPTHTSRPCSCLEKCCHSLLKLLVIFPLVHTYPNRVGVGLRKRDAPTRSLLGEGIVSSYKVGSPNFVVELQHLHNCANVRDLVKDCMFSINHVTIPQAFKVSKDPTDGEVKMQVQERSYKDDWGAMNR